MGFPKLEVSDFSNLILEVHTVGYPVMGESIVTMLKDSGKVLFTMITDCFRTSEADIVTDILNQNGKPSIDVLVWTHPDEDHSVGIETLMETFDSTHQAKIYIPSGIHQDFINNDAAKNALTYLYENYDERTKYSLNPIGSVQGLKPLNLAFEIKERISNRIIFGSIHFLLPNTSMAFRRAFTGARNSGDMNDLSVVYVLVINGVRYFFGADLTKASIKFLTGDNCQPLDNIRYIKIPHHGSKDPIQLTGLLKPIGEKMAVATTTVYNTSNPDSDTLDEYERLCAYVSSTDRGSYPFGDVQLDFNVSDLSVPKALYAGNAKQVRPR